MKTSQTLPLSRRGFLIAGSASLVTLGACQHKATALLPAKKIDQIGIQTYTLRDAFAEDFVGTFEMIKELGYDYVELNSRNLEAHSPEELRKILDGLGLPAPATHVSYEGLATEPEKTGDMVAKLGSRYAILPWVGDDQRTAEAYKRHAEMLNKASEAMKRSGVRAAYHNHQFEFFDLGDGLTGMDILLSETDPDLVDMELDIFWAALAGVSIPDLFADNPGRFKLCHVKDMKGDGSPYRTSLDFATIVGDVMANVGEGDVDFASLFKLNDISGLEYFIIEHDNPPKPYRQAMQTSLTNLRALRF